MDASHPASAPAPGDASRGGAAGAGQPARPAVDPLDALEARALGVLIEKSLTTPDQYPLSLHGLTAGANQKSNRDPVLELDEHDLLDAVNRLREKGLASLVHLSGSRVDKFRHTAREALALEGPALSILAELLLRGPQTPGELRTRASRMVRVDSLEGLDLLLAPLAERGFVKRLPPAPGSRAPRYVQLLAPGIHAYEEGAEPAGAAGPGSAGPAAALRRSALDDRVEALEAEVRALRAELEALRSRLEG